MMFLCLVATAALHLESPARKAQFHSVPTALATSSRPPSAVAVATAAMGSIAFVQPALASDVSWIAPTKLVLGPVLAIGTVLFLIRVVLSWFPKYDLTKLPWSIAAIPTEPLLKPTRAVIPPVAGVDISPLVWVGFLSFCNEILLGPQGLLTIMQRKGGM